MDDAGALAVVTTDAGLKRLLIGKKEGEPQTRTQAAAGRLRELAGLMACLGCATCCRTASPTLYVEDHDLIQKGGLPRDMLYLLRTGERVFSARRQESFLLVAPLIKLRERPGGGCVFLKGNKCVIYENRPRQCRHLACWAGRHAGQLEYHPRLGREALFAHDQTALDLAREYDIKLPAAELDQALSAAALGNETCTEKALGFIDLDHRLRLGIGSRYAYGPPELELLLGRPALALLPAYGLAVTLDQDERPRLRPMPK
jgi:Fe-S-cluster containining protein